MLSSSRNGAADRFRLICSTGESLGYIRTYFLLPVEKANLGEGGGTTAGTRNENLSQFFISVLFLGSVG